MLGCDFHDCCEPINIGCYPNCGTIEWHDALMDGDHIIEIIKGRYSHTETIALVAGDKIPLDATRFSVGKNFFKIKQPDGTYMDFGCQTFCVEIRPNIEKEDEDDLTCPA